MTVTKYYCDKCEKEITDFNEAKEYIIKIIKWDDEYDHSTKILLCKECAMNFHKNVLHCRWEG